MPSNSPISWRSKKQIIVALSNIEAKYMALADTISINFVVTLAFLRILGFLVSLGTSDKIGTM
jgi:hypothetical protein